MKIPNSRWRPIVRALQTLRGVNLIVAVTALPRSSK